MANTKPDSSQINFATNGVGDCTAMTQAAGDATTKVATTAFVDVASGYSRTWQDVAGSRTSGVTYTNTTDSTIDVSVYLTADGSADTLCYLQVGGVAIGLWSHGNDTFTARGSLTAAVPPGVTYSFSIITGALTGRGWMELR